ncbi:hypothetical protein ACPUER_09010 [Burkholderia sp. DN3021]|uniref:hypothetical protein n=1 Tax=Burkholderia sp. DN3021 TaxID=3410137 RepID=UPI003C7C2447
MIRIATAIVYGRRRNEDAQDHRLRRPYGNREAIAIMLFGAMCAVLEDGMISRDVHRQGLTGNTISSPGLLNRFS